MAEVSITITGFPVLRERRQRVIPPRLQLTKRHSRPSERDQGSDISRIRGSKSRDIGASCLSGPGQRRGSPGEHRTTKLMLNKYVGHEPRMAAIAIRETVDADETVLEPNAEFVSLVGPALDPESGIIEQGPQMNRNLELVYSDVLVRRSETTGPGPRATKHPSVQALDEFFGQDFGRVEMCRESPLDSFFDVQLLKFVEFFPRGDRWDEKRILLVFIDRYLPWIDRQP